jgi:hypothetical protein
MAAQIDGSTGISHFWRVDTVFCDSTAEKLIEMTGCDRCDCCDCCDCCGNDIIHCLDVVCIGRVAAITTLIKHHGGTIRVPDDECLVAGFDSQDQAEMAAAALGKAGVASYAYCVGPDDDDDDDDDDNNIDFEANDDDDFNAGWDAGFNCGWDGGWDDGFNCGWTEGRRDLLAQARALIKTETTTDAAVDE